MDLNNTVSIYIYIRGKAALKISGPYCYLWEGAHTPINTWGYLHMCLLSHINALLPWPPPLGHGGPFTEASRILDLKFTVSIYGGKPLFKFRALTVTCGRGRKPRITLEGIRTCVYYHILTHFCHGPTPLFTVIHLRR